ncbi:hypothetical protein SERLA73DRAFT_174144 [Serpula lacrymans var. lacrymans S7.3]|uniref:Uncharacterized protein n=2 Tax=Serpula lacrymans var. lacrymans TaxID=341189 RepID=F8PID4_SERL3|nr:uncharacterized protein SERLADRAFT_455225 [Serpula lacrymans var. lacrymans S7.9]EGO05177.1 hypothetical protein SERLA73DRAFT_174144 [Serpula lacrymans var. lacrymans S7.3]EGO30917.1 hypothetical protein SERLADRAFT_455225 [Serpula lacrymans var. lacrymans S7.9]
MAAPPNVTTTDLSGRYLMNKSLSDSTDEILRLQGVSWFKRRAIATFSLTLTVSHYKDDDGVEHIDIDQTLSGGIPGTREERTLNWESHPNYDDVFGAVFGKSRRVQLEDVDDEFLKNGWTADTAEHGGIQSYVESDTSKSGKTWTAEQIWGFEDKDGVRRYARHVKFTSSDRKEGPILAHLYYDYLGN